ncbi:MAG TPA: T9SS type A sorting domain-containing protein [Cyclobacteriaceae bacterium]|nr:T9SS type A sorting domain-containing protein [Cyclobacteriaceae bacterium]
MKTIVSLIMLSLIFSTSFSQNCTVSNASPYGWSNPGATCSEGGTASGKTILIIPAGKTVDFNSVADTWSGTTIKVYGTLLISADVTIDASIAVYSGGLVTLSAKLGLGSSTGCGYSVDIKSGGTVDVGGTGSDRLNICGANIMKGNGSCNSCSGTNSGTCAYNGNPYCEPSGGFQGPLVYTETGYNGALPIKLSYFTGALKNEKVNLEWATSMQENFDKFIIQRSTNGVDFDSIGVVKGAGINIYDVVSKYSFADEYPLMGVNYYRLKAVDLDFSAQYFNVVPVSFSGKKKIWIEPNPTAGSLIQYKTNFVPNTDDQVVILNNLGVTVNDYTVLKTEGEIEFNTPLTPGVYVIKYKTEDSELSTRALVR